MSSLLHVLRAVYYIYCTPGSSRVIEFVTGILTGGRGVIVDVMDHKRLNQSSKEQQKQRILNTRKFASC